MVKSGAKEDLRDRACVLTTLDDQSANHHHYPIQIIIIIGTRPCLPPQDQEDRPRGGR